MPVRNIHEKHMGMRNGSATASLTSLTPRTSHRAHPSRSCGSITTSVTSLTSYRSAANRLKNHTGHHRRLEHHVDHINGAPYGSTTAPRASHTTRRKDHTQTHKSVHTNSGSQYASIPATGDILHGSCLPRQKHRGPNNRCFTLRHRQSIKTASHHTVQ